jgi:hypothetical protein
MSVVALETIFDKLAVQQYKQNIEQKKPPTSWLPAIITRSKALKPAFGSIWGSASPGAGARLA